MKLFDLLYEMANSLFTNKLRTALTMLGLIIGIVSVVLMLAAVAGVEEMVIKGFGGDKMNVLSLSSSRQLRVGKATQKEINYLKKNMPAIKEVSPIGYAEVEISSGKKKQGDMINIKDEVSLKLDHPNDPWKGRTFSQADMHAPTIILSYHTAKQLFDEPEQAVGKTVKLDGKEFEVIGVSGEMDFSSGNSVVPLDIFERTLRGKPIRLSTYNVVVHEGTDINQAKDVLVKVYTSQSKGMKESDVGVYAFADMLKDVKSFTTIFATLSLIIASTSLSVGGIGIMNMMLTNVTERTNEIGLRKAIGAKSSTITWQFLLEAIAVCLAGCAIAVLVAYLLVAIAAAAIPRLFPDMAGYRPIVTMGSIVLAIGVSTFIAISFGFYPARRASKLDPVEALRFQ